MKRAIKLREHITIFCSRHEKELDSSILTGDDWDTLTTLCERLWPFYDTTIELQSRAGNGHYGSIWEWIPIIEALLKEMEKQIDAYKVRGDTTSWMVMAHQRAWEKLNEYYKMSDHAWQLYAAATLLVPQLRLTYFDDNWTGKSMIKSKKQMVDCVHQQWRSYYKDQVTATDTPERPPSLLSRQIGRNILPDKGDIFLSWISAPQSSSEYCEEHILNYWDSPTAPKKLQQMAYDLMAIPATSSRVPWSATTSSTRYSQVGNTAAHMLTVYH